MTSACGGSAEFPDVGTRLRRNEIDMSLLCASVRAPEAEPFRRLSDKLCADGTYAIRNLPTCLAGTLPAAGRGLFMYLYSQQ